MYDVNYDVKERNLVKAVVFSFITFGIYSFYWLYQLQKDTNRLLGLRNETSPGMVVFLSIITCGIYWAYWAWRQGCKFRDEAQARGSSEADDCPVLYLVLQLFNYLIGVTYIVNQVLMQDRINQLLRMRGMGSRPYDPNRFNHVAEADIAAQYEARARAYEEALAEDEELQDALEGKRALYLESDTRDDSMADPSADPLAGDDELPDALEVEPVLYLESDTQDDAMN